MGGSVGLKGTDGDMYERALELGADPVSPARTREFLSNLGCGEQVHWLAAPGSMGADYLDTFEHQVIGTLAHQSSPDDTKTIARAMVGAGADLIVFAGGDGTARDMVDAVDQQIPVIAIPAGVKIYSAVFAYSPRAAAELLDAYVDDAGIGEEEVLDIDEDAFRDGRVDSKHYGFLLVPEVERLLQGGKDSLAATGSTAAAKRDMAAGVVEEMDSGILYLLGSGTTIRFIADELGIEKTLLGIDAVFDGKLVASDCNEKALLELLERYHDARIIVTPLGGNGFLFGRGNKQFTPAVLSKIGLDNIIVVAHREKLLHLRELHVDTGDSTLDEVLSGYIKVIVGRGHHKLMSVQ
jgi:predicted polyphosphate/ATP-dependent NAD kinase